MPHVTVVMAAFNAGRFLTEGIVSVLTQTYHDFELIVVDDASTDETSLVLQKFDDPRLRIIRHERNLGAASSRNEALLAARGELIAIMDADDVCAPTRLEKQVKFLDDNPTIGLVGCGVYEIIDETGRLLCTSSLPNENDAIQQAIMEWWCFLHSSIMFRKSLYERVGGYRAVFEPAEDQDFVLRVLEHTRAHNLCERLVRYRLNSKGLSVLGNVYASELREAIIRLTRLRRLGKPENLDFEMPRLLELRKSRKSSGDSAGTLQRWNDSLYAACRVYELGCRELHAGHWKNARSCFVESVRTNCLYYRSWVGIGLSLVPSAAHHLRFLFRHSEEVRNLNCLGASMGANIGIER